MCDCLLNELLHEKTNNLHRRKQKAQISFAVTMVTAKLFSAFVFATWIVQFLFFLNPRLFPASSHLLCLYRPVCVGPGRKHKLLVFSSTGSNIQLEGKLKIMEMIHCIPLSNVFIRPRPPAALWYSGVTVYKISVDWKLNNEKNLEILQALA